MIAATLEAAASSGTSLSLPTSIKRIVLTGFMGAGKTTVGRLLAERLGWEFLDLDAHLEARAGASIAELFERNGEAHFRRLESTALASALGRTAIVVALGGGTPEQLTNRLLLEQTPGTTVVFLDAPFPTLYDRCVLQAVARPVLRDPLEAEARLRARLPVYQRLARLTVETSALLPEAIAEQITERLTRV